MSRSWQDLISRNEILRTVFVKTSGHCVGVILEDLMLPVIDYDIEGELEIY